MTAKKLNRRRFLEASGAGITGLALAQTLRGQPRTTVVSTAPRHVYALNHGWLYHEQNAPGATRTGFNDAAFKRVTIPHANKVLPWHGFDDKEYEFVSIYRKHFRLPAELRERRVFVDFGAVMTAATVWINGQRLGEYRGGYTPFSFELTPH